MISDDKAALIIGGSLGGMLAAQVLAPLYSRVIIFEPDQTIGQAIPRKGAPHVTQVHRLLPGGHQALEALLPGFTVKLESQGAQRNYQGFEDGGQNPHTGHPYFGFYCTRLLVEQLVYQQITPLPNLTWIPEKVSEIVLENHQATGIKTQAGTFYTGALVVDASGSDRFLRRLLTLCHSQAALYLHRPCGLKYASCLYQRTQILPDKRENLWAHPQLESSYGALLLPVEKSRWLCTLSSYHRDLPPKTPAEFMQQVQALATPDIFELLRSEIFLEGVYIHAYPQSYRHVLRQAKPLPKRYLPLGDTFCTVNPLNGMGMAMVAKMALHLGHCLTPRPNKHPEIAYQTYYQGLNQMTEAPWVFSLPHDIAYTQNPQLSQWDSLELYYLSLFQKTCTFDESARRIQALALGMLCDGFNPRVFIQSRLQQDPQFKTRFSSQIWF